jgi:hypothetical protein
MNKTDMAAQKIAAAIFLCGLVLLAIVSALIWAESRPERLAVVGLTVGIDLAVLLVPVDRWYADGSVVSAIFVLLFTLAVCLVFSFLS